MAHLAIVDVLAVGVALCRGVDFGAERQQAGADAARKGTGRSKVKAVAAVGAATGRGVV
jgi:hypothetical protein